MDLLANLYTSNYIFYPIHYIFDIFFQLNEEYIKYVKTTYSPMSISISIPIPIPIPNQNNYISILDFAMIKNFNTLDEIKSNPNVFVNICSNIYNVETEYVISLRKVSLFPKITLLVEYLVGNYNLIMDKEKLFNEAIFDSVINKFTIYEYNNDKKTIKVHLTHPDKYKKIKKNISTYFILLSNILNYIGGNNKYPEITENDYDYNYSQLFDMWIEPIEPDNIIDYKKIFERKINEEIIEIDGLVYTDILCYRNFIQYEYQAGLRILYPRTDNIIQNDIIHMPILFTTYRINQQGQILTILH